MTKLIFRSDVALARDPGFGRAEVLPSFGRPLFCYLLGSAFSARPQRDLYGRAADLAVTGGFDPAGFQAHTGTAFIDLPYNGRSALAAAAAAMAAAGSSNAGMTITLLAKTKISTLLIGDGTAQPSTEPRNSVYRLPGNALVSGTINDGSSAGANSATSVLDQQDGDQDVSYARYTMMTDGVNIQVAYRRSAYAGGVEQVGPLATKSDADPVGNPNGLYRLGRAFPGSNLPTNENLYVAIHATWGMSTAAERAVLDRQLAAVLGERGISF